ncbi:MAG: hypothetical protein B6D56_02720 [Candidatus Omnitrophica bacterium 4484_70.1]|nr:MAG: hypothetical protein B6D56_02720 [Candidatus Omnitrophica bacterium 4484_70.1]
MYLQFYGLKEPPFGVTCDLQFFFEGSSHKEALASLIYGIKEKKGLILITGEVGVGKTILCKALMEKLPSSVRVSLLLNPYFSEIQSKLRQLRQRIFVKYHLSPLRKEEVKKYVEFRLKKAGNLFLKFSPQSYDIIYEFSQGIPRLINMICERALICGFVKERKMLDEEIFYLCREELG